MEYEVTKNLLQHGRFDLRDPQFLEIDAARGIDGQLYSPHGLGQSLAMIPFYLLGEGIARISPAISPMRAHHFLISFMNPIVAAILCLLLFRFQTELGFSNKTAFLATCICGTCTLIFPYAKVSFDVMLTACLLFGAMYSLYTYRRTFHDRWAWLGGVLCACALITRIASLIVVPFYLIYLGLPGSPGSPERSRLLHRLACFAFPLLLAIGAVAFYNATRFGTVLNDGHAADAAVRFTTPLWLGFMGQTISPGKGLLWYSPVLVFAPCGWRMLYQRYKPEAFLFLSFILANLLFYSKLSNWSGDWCWGPRFTILIIPFLGVGLGSFLHRRHGWNRWLRSSWLFVLALSLAVQILGVTVDGTRRIGRRYTVDHISSAEIYWDPGASPILDHMRLFGRLSFSPQYRTAGHEAAERIEFDDATADFWFVYLESMGFSSALIIICLVTLVGVEVCVSVRLFRILVVSGHRPC
jgi:hypothetical protein